MSTTPEEALAILAAVHAGEHEVLQRLVAANPEVATSRLGGIAKGRTALHIVADWPGYFPNGPRIAQLLIDAGADVNDRGTDEEHGETPLHWVASSDDADVARLLVARGAKVDQLWHAAALGLLNPLEVLLAEESEHTPEKISQAFWHACDGGQRRSAELLLEHGADLNWTPDYAQGTPLDAARRQGTRESNVIEWLESRGAGSSESTEGRTT